MVLFEETEYLIMERLTTEHLDAMEKLQESIKCSLENPDLMVPLSRQELTLITSGKKGMSVGVINMNDELVGVLGALYPGRSKDNLGFALSMGEEEVDQVFHIEISFIHPDYRKKRLMVKMCRWLLQQVKLEGDYRYACATVSPLNIGSLQNMMLSGNAVANLQQMYDGLDRYILFQDLLEPYRFHEDDTLFVPIEKDPLAPATFLQKGYKGVGLAQKEKEIVMVMRRPV